MKLRRYDPAVDKAAVIDIWHDCNWLDKTDEKSIAEMDPWFACGKAYVAEFKGRPECSVTIHEGTLRYGAREIPLAGVTGVATSFIGRKEGLAARLTAFAVAENVHLPVAGLGFFEQGFYDRFGFGAGPYENEIRFDPAHLKVTRKARAPVRITADDWEAVHESRLRTPRGHGGQTITSPGFTRARMKKEPKGFGLGYRARDGRITHHVWFREREGYSGPLHVQWISYENLQQFLEIMALLKRMGDQIRTVAMREPPGFQLQDLIRHPFRDGTARDKSKHETGVRSYAHWQMRMNDVEACLAATRISCRPLSFNLRLADPIADHLKGHRWKGVRGRYIVTLGRKSSAKRGADKSLATLKASVNAFTRLWLGVVPATTLSVTDELSGPAELLSKLDEAIVLPVPRTAWAY
ncbi:MAG: GNAT family N-acetyltransferase [Planctomycetota bacterium]|jgi:predicted acetyltransferase